MKKIISIILGLVMCISLTSCVTTAYAQTDDDVDVNVVVTYGTPYYNESGLLLYFIYRNLYYYPYYYGNRWYFRHYTRPLPRGSYRPLPRDFHRHRHHTTTQHRPHMGGNNGFGNHQPNMGNNRPNGGNNRPHTPRNNNGNHRYGGKR